MEAIEHLIIASIASPLAAWTLAGPDMSAFIFLTVWGLVAGVLIDLDHFLVARIKNGDWSVLLRALKDPLAAWTNWRKIIDPVKDVPAEHRLMVHITVAIAVSAVLIPFNTQLFYMTALMTSIHILSDLYADIRNGYGHRYLPPSILSLRKLFPDQRQDE